MFFNGSISWTIWTSTFEPWINLWIPFEYCTNIRTLLRIPKFFPVFVVFGGCGCVGGSAARQRSRRNAIDSAVGAFTASCNWNWQHRKWVNENRIRFKRSCVWKEINNKWQQHRQHQQPQPNKQQKTNNRQCKMQLRCKCKLHLPHVANAVCCSMLCVPAT